MSIFGNTLFARIINSFGSYILLLIIYFLSEALAASNETYAQLRFPVFVITTALFLLLKFKDAKRRIQQ
jgi:hypothetical protein